MKKIIISLTRILNVIFVIFTLVLLMIIIFKKDWVILALDWVEVAVKGLGSWNYLIIFVSAIIESFPFLGIVVPGMNVLILVGGFFVGYNPSVFFLCMIIAAVGACIGNATGFWLGQYAGREFLAKYGNWFGIGSTEMKYLEKAMQSQGFWFIVTAKFHNVLRAFIPYIAGAAGMNTSKFWLYNMIGAIIWSWSVLLIGIFFIENYELILRYFGWIFLAVIVIFFAYMVKFQRAKLMKFIEEKNQELNNLTPK